MNSLISPGARFRTKLLLEQTIFTIRWSKGFSKNSYGGIYFNRLLVSDIDYVYDTAFNIVKTLTKNSRQEQIEDIVHFPYEYTSTIGQAMKAKNMYGVSVAAERWKTISGTKYLTEVYLVNTCKPPVALESTIEAFESSSPVANSNVLLSILALSTGLRHCLKKRFRSTSITAKFISQQAKSNDAPQSIIWGHNHQMPIAEVINATVDKIAYTSFEEDGYGGWTLNGGGTLLTTGAVTGTRSLNGGVTKAVPSGNYIVGVWSTGNPTVNGVAQTQTPNKVLGNWRYFEVSLTNVTSITVLGTNIDEVRLFPAGAQISTLIYNPLYGVTSQCDVSNKILYYEYDGFGRLKTVRDENKNILKTLDYQFPEKL